MHVSAALLAMLAMLTTSLALPGTGDPRGVLNKPSEITGADSVSRMHFDPGTCCGGEIDDASFEVVKELYGAKDDDDDDCRLFDDCSFAGLFRTPFTYRKDYSGLCRKPPNQAKYETTSGCSPCSNPLFSAPLDRKFCNEGEVCFSGGAGRNTCKSVKKADFDAGSCCGGLIDGYVLWELKNSKAPGFDKGATLLSFDYSGEGDYKRSFYSGLCNRCKNKDGTSMSTAQKKEDERGCSGSTFCADDEICEDKFWGNECRKIPAEFLRFQQCSSAQPRTEEEEALCRKVSEPASEQPDRNISRPSPDHH